ncbi:MAG: UTP--glucose-1-phosphate uridylyltransferase [bacterium]
MTGNQAPALESLRRVAGSAGQEHLFRYWDRLSNASRQQLLQQVAMIDFKLVAHLHQHLVLAEPSTHEIALEPPEMISLREQQEQPRQCREMITRGEELLRGGKVAALLVAGGQGSRLGFDGPKGVYAIGPLSKKSLFQLHAEKLLAMSQKYRAVIPWYIMTSVANDADTRGFFEKHRYFGLNPRNVFFFIQGMIPAIDVQGKIIMDAADHIFMNPDGHGGVLTALGKSGALADMRKRGIAEIFYFQVDNVLVNMCDPLFIGFHVAAGADMSAKVCGKRDPFEKVGVIGKKNGKLAVIEYSDMSDQDKEARNPDGSLQYNAGNVALHMFRTGFIEHELEAGAKLPWHLAHKQIPCLNDHGELVQPNEPNGYKFETFVFDALGDAKACVLLEVERFKEFSPIKNYSGLDSPLTARRDMSHFYADWLEKAGVSVARDDSGWPIAKIEISPLFAMTAEELAHKLPPHLKLGRELYLA